MERDYSRIVEKLKGESVSRRAQYNIRNTGEG
jgi:hypothetical protein